MSPRLAVLIGLFLVAIAAASPGLADQTAGVALLIGNAVYPDADAPLTEPVADARALGDELRRRGFDVTIGENLKKVPLQHALDQFYAKLNSSTTAVIFFSGFGIQSGRRSYLIPVDAQIWSESDVRRDGFSIDAILAQVAGRGAQSMVAIVDGSRRNPFERRFRDVSAGLAAVTAPRGTVAMMSAPPDTVVDTSPPVFMADLLNELRVAGATTEQVFNRTRLDVSRDTKTQQVPWFASSLDVDVTLGSPSRPAGTVAVQPSSGASPHQGAADTTRRDFATDCDRLAANPSDQQRPPGVAGVLRTDAIDIVPALKACNDAMRQYPDVARFVVEAGRVAYAQKDYAAAFQLFDKAAGMGSTLAVAETGLLYMNGQGVARDYLKAKQSFEDAAAAESPVAMTNLGILYANGWGVMQDYAQARQWYEKAAIAGAAPAMENLGWFYQNGFGGSKDYTQAHQWYEKAAAAGVPAAMNNLGVLYANGWGVARDYEQSRQWYEKAAAAGERTAMDNLGWYYQNGFGVDKDYTQARQWYEKSVAAGLPAAMNNLGVLYGNGWGVTQDYAQARQWYEKAADKGNSLAMNNLGWYYQNGFGVTKDYAQARQWYEKAAATGSAPAMNNLGNLYGNGWGVTQDYAQARQWYEKSAAAGNSLAMNNLGWYYQNGFGVAKDLTQARQWYEKAAAAGNEAAKENLQKLNDKK